MYMHFARLQAEKVLEHNDVPIGAVIVHKNQIIAAAGNEVEKTKDPTAHAEIQAIRMATQYFQNMRLEECDMYVTLEPCPMCAQAISFARIRRLYFGAYDPKGGGVEHGPRIYEQESCHHKPEVHGGIEETLCAQLLQDFFKGLRGE